MPTGASAPLERRDFLFGLSHGLINFFGGGEGAVPEFLVGFVGGREFPSGDVGGGLVGDGDEFLGEGEAFVGFVFGGGGKIEEAGGVEFPVAPDLFEDDCGTGLFGCVVGWNRNDRGIAGDFDGGIMECFHAAGDLRIDGAEEGFGGVAEAVFRCDVKRRLCDPKIDDGINRGPIRGGNVERGLDGFGVICFQSGEEGGHGFFRFGEIGGGHGGRSGRRGVKRQSGCEEDDGEDSADEHGFPLQ